MDMVNLEQVSNAMVTEYRFQLDVEWASFIVRQYAGKEEYEVEWLVGPIPGSMSVISFGRGREGAVLEYIFLSFLVEDSQGKEVIFRYDSETILNDDEFWTDSNGRQMIQRKRDQRTSFDFTQEDVDKEPTASNYYPVTTGRLKPWYICSRKS